MIVSCENDQPISFLSLFLLLAMPLFFVAGSRNRQITGRDDHINILYLLSYSYCITLPNSQSLMNPLKNIRVINAHSRSPSPEIHCPHPGCSLACKSRDGLKRHFRSKHPSANFPGDVGQEVSSQFFVASFIDLN